MHRHGRKNERRNIYREIFLSVIAAYEHEELYKPKYVRSSWLPSCLTTHAYGPSFLVRRSIVDSGVLSSGLRAYGRHRT